MYIIKILYWVYVNSIIDKSVNFIIMILVHHSDNMVIMGGIQGLFHHNHVWGLSGQDHRNNWYFYHSLGLNSNITWKYVTHTISDWDWSLTIVTEDNVDWARGDWKHFKATGVARNWKLRVRIIFILPHFKLYISNMIFMCGVNDKNNQGKNRLFYRIIDKTGIWEIPTIN